MIDLVSKAIRVMGVCALLALAVFTTVPKPAEACYPSLVYADACIAVVDTICSANNDGTGRRYVAKEQIYFACL